MKNITLVSLTMCLILVIVLAISAATLADIASETNTKAEQHFEKANDLLKRTEYEAAIAEYKKVINLSSNSKIAQNAQYWIGQSHFRAGQFEAAQATFAKLIEEYPASAIVPVTKLMVGRVQQAKENEEIRKTISDALDKGIIIDPKTGVKYTKTRTFVGKRDVIDWPSYLDLSPNGKFLLRHKLVLPLDSGDPFELVDMPAYSGRWSPDGKQVVFNSGGAIWVVPVSPETGRPTAPAKKLLDGNYRLWSPRWSPDGEKLVFSREEDEVSGDIWTLSVKDGALTQITDDPLNEQRPLWSHDGKTIVYKVYKRGWRLVPAEGGTPRKISFDEARLLSFPRSPDGKWRFYKKANPGNLLLFRLADERVFEITPPGRVGYFLSMSPDGKKMLFYDTSYEYTCTLKVVSASGGPSFELGTQLPLATLWPYQQYWSPDSKMIITKGYNDEWPDWTFWISPLAGGEALPLEFDVSVDGEVEPCSLSPNGKKLLFVVYRSDKTVDLYVAPVSLEDVRTTGPAVMVFRRRDKRPIGGWKMSQWSWSPDGSKLAVIHGGDIWITSAGEGKPVRITNTPEREIRPVWSPDGEMIAYRFRLSVFAGEGQQILHVISASGGEATEILDTPASRGEYAWSPDGKEIAVISEGVLSAIPIAGGKARQILDLKHQGFVKEETWGLCWLPEGKYLAFISQKAIGGPTGNRIFMVPAEGGKVTELATDDDGWKDYLYPSPDGKWISYDSEVMVKTRSEGAIWEADFEEIVKKASR